MDESFKIDSAGISENSPGKNKDYFLVMETSEIPVN